MPRAASTRLGAARDSVLSRSGDDPERIDLTGYESLVPDIAACDRLDRARGEHQERAHPRLGRKPVYVDRGNAKSCRGPVGGTDAILSVDRPPGSDRKQRQTDEIGATTERSAREAIARGSCHTSPGRRRPEAADRTIADHNSERPACNVTWHTCATTAPSSSARSSLPRRNGCWRPRPPAGRGASARCIDQ